MIPVFLYDNFELYNPFISVKLIVWALFAGFIVAALMAIYQKRLVGGVVKAILSGGATSPEKAMTVSELGYATDWFAKNALRRDAALLRFVSRVDAAAEAPKKDETDGAESAEGANKAEKAESEKPQTTRSGAPVIDFETARFYIPDELRYKAEVRYARKGTDFVSFGICIVIFVAAAFAAIFLIPDLIQLIDNFVGTFK